MKELIGTYIINNPIFWVGLLVIILLIFFYNELKKNTNIHRAQKRLDKKKYTILNDVVLESQRRSYTLDTVIISSFGIFVIKYVDYDGKIYGDERELSWIQLKDNKKVYFDNPARELHSNVRVISNVLDLNEKYFIPIICFTKEATLSLDIKDKVTQIEFLDDVVRSYKKEILKYGLKEIKQKIISGKSDYVSTTVADDNPNTCPNCGSKLVVRKGKYGDFVGCSNYPNCKYTREL